MFAFIARPGDIVIGGFEESTEKKRTQVYMVPGPRFWSASSRPGPPATQPAEPSGPSSTQGAPSVLLNVWFLVMARGFSWRRHREPRRPARAWRGHECTRIEPSPSGRGHTH